MAGVDMLAGLNADQRAIAQTLNRPLFVEAGAGSGKTFTLTQRIAWALCPGSGANGKPFLDSLNQVLVITFTEAAAREIRERVRKTLRAEGARQPELRAAALAVDSAWISTIHGMCSRILHQHALDLGIDPNFVQASENQADELMSQALDEVLGQAYRLQEFRELFEEYGYGRSFSGGTTTGVLDLVVRMIAAARRSPHGFDDLVLIGNANTDSIYRAALRLRDGFEELAARKLTPAAQQTTETSREILGSLVLEGPKRTAIPQLEAELEKVSVPRSSKTIADIQPDLVSALALVRAELAFVAAGAFGDKVMELARRVKERFSALKRANSLLDHDDLIALALKAVKEHPEVAADYVHRFRLVMVDEFQDTDSTQLELISLLAGSNAEHLCTVGDAQQSIYRFRGADVEVFRRHGAGFSPEQVVKLQTNYRSHADILSFVERVCGGMPTADGRLTGGVLRGYMHLDAWEGREDGYAARELPRIAVEAVVGPGVSGHSSKYQTATLAAQMADRLARYVDAGTPAGDIALLLGATSHATSYIDALRARGLECVVTGGSIFSSSLEAQIMCALLYALANPGDTASGLFPLLSSEVFGLDADDFCMLGTRQQEKLDAPTKRQIDRGFQDMSFYGELTPSARLMAAHQVLMRAWADLAHKSVADVCLQVVRDSGWLARLSQLGAEGMARAANVLAAVRYIRDLTDGLGLGASRAAQEFSLWLELAKVPPASFAGGAGGTIQVMTIHASKGLEFPVVAVSECWSNSIGDSGVMSGTLKQSADHTAQHPKRIQACVLCPRDASKLVGKIKVPEAESWKGSQNSTITETFLMLKQQNEEQDREEKARLLYVALTRAQEALVLGISCASSKQGISSKLAAASMKALVGSEIPPAGETRIEYGGSSAATLRVVEVEQPKVSKGAPRQLRLNSNESLHGFDAQLIDPDPQDLLVLGTADEKCDQKAVERAFALYTIEAAPQSFERSWRPREGVFSFSGMKAKLDAEARDAAAQEVSLPYKDALQEGPLTTAAHRSIKCETRSLSSQDSAKEERSSFDADRATSFGSAFHELAQTMIETGNIPSDEQRARSAELWHLSARGRSRLEVALERWTHSSIRAEALSYTTLRAELPFFAPAPKGTERFGDYIEGAIDLLCTNTGSSQALLIDYKTGDKNLTEDEIYARHKLQATLYARVLMQQGFTEVTCAFVCIELDAHELVPTASAGEPYVVRYEFLGSGEE